MMEKSKLRGADIVTSLIFFLLSIWIIAEAFTMPLKDSYAGVDSVWYVSPALMPLIVGAAMLLLSIAIFLHAKRNGGLESLKAIWASQGKNKFFSDANIRYACVLIPLISLVYVNLTRIDFFLSIVLYLGFTVSVFYLDNPSIMRKTLLIYTAETCVLLVLTVFGLDKVLTKLFNYSLDIIALAMIISITVVLMRQIRKSGNPEYKKKFRSAMWMTYITPLFIVPIFRYMLRVPLPREGAVVDLMSLLYYTITR
ncbi:MAG: hypothetical protein Q8O15_09580 [Rectinemataceae bacterium]|nr:hypothetical protein [Rectinemataceae bacterium]